MSTPPPAQPPPDDPHVGSEDDPRREADPHDEVAVVPPRRYEPAAGETGGADVDRAKAEPTVADRLVAASGPLALIAFFLIGFGTGRWYVAWVVFLVPAALRAWNRP